MNVLPLRIQVKGTYTVCTGWARILHIPFISTHIDLQPAEMWWKWNKNDVIWDWIQAATFDLKTLWLIYNLVFGVL